MTVPLIPRLIHRIWVGGPLPEVFREYGETWARHHPKWEMLLWHDGNLPVLRNQAFYDRATDFAPSKQVGQFRADVLRYELLWQFGGMYVDADFECLRSIEPLIKDADCFATWESEPRRIANGLMGARPGHSFIDALIRGLPRSITKRRGQRPVLSTGPQYLTEAFRRTPGELTVLPSRFFYPYSWSDVGTVKSLPPWPAECYAVHHWNNRRRMVGEGET